MPRLAQSTAEKQARSVNSQLSAYIYERERAGWDKDRISRALGFPYSTLRLRRQNPEKFTLGELQGIANTLNITVSTLIGERSQS